MAEKPKRQTKSRIVSAAWRLFYEKGYDDTTVDEIIAEAGTSKGSFYHYFEGKDALLSSLSILSLIAELEDEFDITIPAVEIIPANFNSAKAMWSMIQRLQEED